MSHRAHAFKRQTDTSSTNTIARLTRRAMLDELKTLGLSADAQEAMTAAILEAIYEDSKLSPELLGYWNTPLGSRQLQNNGGSITAWELAVTTFVAAEVKEWNRLWSCQGNSGAKSRNEDRMRAQVARHVMPLVTTVFRSPLLKKSKRWVALIAVMQQQNRSGLYAQMDDLIS